jgi:hypothetical protein
MPRENQRKTVIVDGPTQLRIVVTTSLPMIGCLMLAVVIEILYARLVASGKIVSDGTIFGFPEARLGMLCLFVSASTVQLLTALLTSHKVAGTSYRIGQVLRRFREGDRAVRVRLRRTDYQHVLAEDVNAFLDWTSRTESSVSEESTLASAPSVAGASASRPATSTAKDAAAREPRRRDTAPSRENR